MNFVTPYPVDQQRRHQHLYGWNAEERFVLQSGDDAGKKISGAVLWTVLL